MELLEEDPEIEPECNLIERLERELMEDFEPMQVENHTRDQSRSGRRARISLCQSARSDFTSHALRPLPDLNQLPSKHESSKVPHFGLSKTLYEERDERSGTKFVKPSILAFNSN